MLNTLLTNFQTIKKYILNSKPEDWNSLKITYEEPNVDRLWISWGTSYRLCLHIIHPCNKPFYHPHDWESACYILFNSYKMKLGLGSNSMLIESVYASGSFYEMIYPNLWHSVEPLNGLPVFSIMLMGNKYSEPVEPLKRPEKHENQLLCFDEIEKQLNAFKVLLKTDKTNAFFC